MLGTFYYPWYGDGKNLWRHWKEANHIPPGTWASNFSPDIGSNTCRLYSSDDVEIQKQQISLMKRAGLEFAVSSWWGRDDYTDQVFKSVLEVSKQEYPGLKWALYYEKEGYANLQQAEIESDLKYVINTYGKDPNYLKIDAKLVIFVYSNSDDSVEYIQKWGRVRQNVGGVYIVLKIVKGFRQYANLADSWHQYAPANRFANLEPYSAFVSPGYWKYHEDPKLERNLGQFKDAVRQMKGARVQFQLVETWNEYHEGTMIESAVQIAHDDANPPFKPAAESYGTQFIDVLRN
jgi:hypothetical protein